MDQNGHNPGDGGSISLLMSQRPRSKYKTGGISYHNEISQRIYICPFHVHSLQNCDFFNYQHLATNIVKHSFMVRLLQMLFRNPTCLKKW